MDRAVLEAHLTLAERHVADGRRHVERQRKIVGEAVGEDAERSIGLLRELETMQRMHEAHRESIRQMIARTPTED